MSTATGGWIGVTLADGRYHVTRVLGEGGMGVAYLAYDARLETEVVLKVPHRHLLTSPEVVQRFEREIRSLVALSHPHVVRVTDVAKHDGVPYTVLQYLSGGSLDDRLRQLPPDANLWQRCELLLSWIEAIAKALDFVHEHGCVHRDVKPGNILFDKHGNAYLADFGVAKTIADQQNAKQATALTGQGMVLGTPDYMAPELITAKQFDGRVDQYALAFTAYEVLAGRLPLSAPSPTAMLVAHATQQPDQLAHVLPALPVGVTAAVTRGMAKRPQERHPNCYAMAVEIVAALRAAPRAELEAVRVTGQTVQEPARLACPACQKALRVPPELRGKRVPCSKCRTLLWVAPDLQRLELASAATSVSAGYAAQLPSTTAGVPMPTIPIGAAPPRAPVPPPLTRPATTLLAQPDLASDEPTVSISPATWGVIGSVSGVLVLALLYFGFIAGKGTAPDRDKVVVSDPSPVPTQPPFSRPIKTPQPTAPQDPNDAAKNRTGPQLLPGGKGVKGTTDPDAAIAVPPEPMPTQPTPPTQPPVPPKSKPPSRPTPQPTPPAQPMPPVNNYPPVTTPIAVKPPLAGPFAKLPKRFAIPDSVTGENPVPVKLGPLELKADETLELKLLTDIDGLKPKKSSSAAPTTPGLPAKKDYKLIFEKAGTSARWNITARVQSPGMALTKLEPDLAVGEFFYADDHLQFQWAAKVDEAQGNLLRNTVLVAKVGSAEHVIAMRDVMRQPPMTIDLGQKITTVKLTGVKGLPPESAIWLEVLDAQGFPGQLSFDPEAKRAQGRKLDVIMNAAKPRVRVEIDLNVSSSSGALLFKPLYEVFGTQDEDFTTDHLDKYRDIRKAIVDGENTMELLERTIANLRSDLASVFVSDSTDLNQVQAAKLKTNRIQSQINSAASRHSAAKSTVARLRVIETALPTLQNMAQVHQRGRLSYRVFYVVGGHEVEILRADGAQP